MFFYKLCGNNSFLFRNITIFKWNNNKKLKNKFFEEKEKFCEKKKVELKINKSVKLKFVRKTENL